MTIERKPVAFGDFRGWLAALKAADELREIEAEVDWNIELGTIARLAQGATAAMMVPQVLATIHLLFPDSARSRAFGIYGIVLGLAGAAGFALGGLLVTSNLAGLGWRAVFFVRVPCRRLRELHKFLHEMRLRPYSHSCRQPLLEKLSPVHSLSCLCDSA